MSVAIVREYLKQFDKEKDVQEFEVSSATVDLASEAVGVIPARIAKSLTFLSKDGTKCFMILAAGDAKIDNHKYKHFFGCKAKMLTAEQLEEFTGHPAGGVCPFALPEGKCDVYLDESMKRFETVFPAAGSAASAVEMTCEELQTCSGALAWIDVTKGWQEEETEA